MDSSNGKSEPKKVSKRINTLMQEMGIVDDGERLTQWVKTTLSTLSDHSSILHVSPGPYNNTGPISFNIVETV